MSNDELQKAIDDITSGDNGTVAPVASSDDTATVSLPEEMGLGQQGEEKIAENSFEMPAFSAPAAAAPDLSGLEQAMASEKPEEKTGAESVAVPNFEVPSIPSADTLPKEPEIAAPEVTVPTEAPAEAPADFGADTVASEVKMPELSETGPEDPQLKEVETAALLELYPLLEKMNVNAREKFDICMKVIEKTGEKGASAAALSAAKEIADETEKGECLVKLVEAIDKM